MNIVCLIGRLTETPQCRQSKKGKDYATFSLEVPHPFFENQPSTFSCTAWGKAFLTAKDLMPGNLVAVSGCLQQRKFQTKEGQAREVVEVSADRVELLAANLEEKDRAEAEEEDPWGEQ